MRRLYGELWRCCKLVGGCMAEKEYIVEIDIDSTLGCPGVSLGFKALRLGVAVGKL